MNESYCKITLLSTLNQIMYGPPHIKNIYNVISNSISMWKWKFKIGKIKSDHIGKGFHYTLA